MECLGDCEVYDLVWTDFFGVWYLHVSSWMVWPGIYGMMLTFAGTFMEFGVPRIKPLCRLFKHNGLLKGTNTSFRAWLLTVDCWLKYLLSWCCGHNISHSFNRVRRKFSEALLFSFASLAWRSRISRPLLTLFRCRDHIPRSMDFLSQFWWVIWCWFNWSRLSTEGFTASGFEIMRTTSEWFF
jgi:hypothetical protein